MAQKQREKKPDTLKLKHFVPTGLRIGTDAIALIRSSTDESFSGWEVNADVDFYRYFLTVDVGSWSRDYQTDNDQYSNEGSYFRAGVDFNFLPRDPNGNALIFGARYARSIFSEDYLVAINDPVWGEFDQSYHNTDVAARWFELTGGLRVKIWSWIWLGYTARYKFGIATGDTPEMLPHDIPGYGRTDKNSTWGFNYLILLRIPFKD
jgi:hypothetical protein